MIEAAALRREERTPPTFDLPFFFFFFFFLGPLLCKIFMVPSSRAPLSPLEGVTVRSQAVILGFQPGLAFPLQAHIFSRITTSVSQMSLFLPHCLLSDGQCQTAFCYWQTLSSHPFFQIQISRNRHLDLDTSNCPNHAMEMTLTKASRAEIARIEEKQHPES